MSFKLGVRNLTSMSTMEAELVTSAVAKKGAVFRSNMLTELEFVKEFEKVPLHIDNTATLHVVGDRAFSSRPKHIALRLHGPTATSGIIIPCARSRYPVHDAFYHARFLT